MKSVCTCLFQEHVIWASRFLKVFYWPSVCSVKSACFSSLSPFLFAMSFFLYIRDLIYSDYLWSKDWIEWIYIYCSQDLCFHWVTDIFIVKERGTSVPLISCLCLADVFLWCNKMAHSGLCYKISNCNTHRVWYCIAYCRQYFMDP